MRAAEPLGFDADLWRKLAELGTVGMGVPEACGGGGAALLDMALVAEEYGSHLAPAPLVETAVAARLLAALDGEAAAQRLRAALDGEELTTLALHARAKGERQLVPAGAVAATVLGLDGDELVAVVRPAPAEPRAPANLGSSPLAWWSLSGGEPAHERHVLARGTKARSAFHAAVEDWKRLTSAALVGLSRRALALGVDYATHREQFGVPIGTYQAISHRLADCATSLDGARLLVWEAVWAAENALPEAEVLGSMAFTFAAETASDVVAASLHVHGGYGFTLEYDIQLFFRRAKAWALIYDDPRAELARLADRLYGPPGT